jgi:pantetheine-phosphate adenylyltransferase
VADKRAIYAGSFDLLTNGHLWMIRQGVELFGDLTVAVGVNPDKRPMFTASERITMIRDCTPELDVQVIELPPRALLVEYAADAGFDYLLRGIRTTTDFQFERAMRNVNADIVSFVQTVALIPPRELMDVSSSMVKGLIGCGDWPRVVGKYVPTPVVRVLEEKFKG